MTTWEDVKVIRCLSPFHDPLALMKKKVIITARITHEIKETIQSLADKDERTLAWMIRRLILEALGARVFSNVPPFMVKLENMIPAAKQPART